MRVKRSEKRHEKHAKKECLLIGNWPKSGFFSENFIFKETKKCRYERGCFRRSLF